MNSFYKRTIELQNCTQTMQVSPPYNIVISDRNCRDIPDITCIMTEGEEHLQPRKSIRIMTIDFR